MAERRMFARSVIESDQFLDLPHSAQALYLHLGVNADDDGFVSNYKMIMRCCNAGPSDLEALIRADFIIRFESGILVIRHWKISNYIQNDRYTPSLFTKEKEQLRMERGKPYTFLNPQNSPDTPCIHDVSSTDTVCTHSIGKGSIGKVSLGEDRGNRGMGEEQHSLPQHETGTDGEKATVPSANKDLSDFHDRKELNALRNRLTKLDDSAMQYILSLKDQPVKQQIRAIRDRISQIKTDPAY